MQRPQHKFRTHVETKTDASPPKLAKNQSKVVKFRLENAALNETALNQTQTPPSDVDMKNEDAIFFDLLSKEKLVDLFWSVVPREDLLLAVIVPVTIICSLCILTVVVACLLHMCNKNYRQTRKSSKSVVISTSTTIDSTNTGSAGSHTLDKQSKVSSSSSTASGSSVNPIYKQRAYLSKGVPVILYEEMSDKPIDDYDENHRDVMDSSANAGSGNAK